jgi:ribosomal-protein-serine acetyltransferase
VAGRRRRGAQPGRRREPGAPAAVQLVVLAFADPAVTHVEIHHDLANVASGRVAARLGFTVADEIEKPAAAPGECGRTRIWRLER